MYKQFLILLISFAICSCNQNATANKEETPANTADALSGLPQDIKQNIIANCDYIDYTFYDLNFSMSQSDPAAVGANIALLSDDVQAQVPTNCKPIGRKYYHINGEIVMEAELYYAEGCLCYIYKKGNTTLYGNKLSPGSIDFYNKIFSQATRTQTTGTN